MANKKSNKLLNSKDYLLLTIGLIIFFIGGSYLLSGGNIPKNSNFIYMWVAVVVVSILIVLYVFKKLSKE